MYIHCKSRERTYNSRQDGQYEDQPLDACKAGSPSSSLSAQRSRTRSKRNQRKKTREKYTAEEKGVEDGENRYKEPERTERDGSLSMKKKREEKKRQGKGHRPRYGENHG